MFLKRFWSKKISKIFDDFFLRNFSEFSEFSKISSSRKIFGVLNGIYFNSTLPAALPGPAGLDLVAPQALYEEVLEYRSRVFDCPGYTYM